MEILLYQMDVKFGKPEENFQNLRETLNEVLPTPKTIVTIPELFLTGYDRDSIVATGAPLQENEYAEKLLKLCQIHDIYIYGSLAAQLSGQVYNTALLVGPDGLIDFYQKSHLFGPMGEKQLFSPGNSVKVSNIEGIRAGLSVCYDLRFPELYQLQSLKDMDLTLICAEWPITRIQHWRALLKARAIENQCFAVGVNRVGTDPDYTYGGHSVIYSPYGEIVAELPHADEAIVSTTIILDEVTDFREKFDVRKDKWIGKGPWNP